MPHLRRMPQRLPRRLELFRGRILAWLGVVVGVGLGLGLGLDLGSGLGLGSGSGLGSGLGLGLGSAPSPAMGSRQGARDTREI